MSGRRNFKTWLVIAVILLWAGCGVAAGAELHLRVTTDKETYIVGEEVKWTIWAWASQGDNRGVALIDVSLNDNRSEELYPPLTVGTPPNEEFLDTEYGLGEGFIILGKGDTNINPPRLRDIIIEQITKTLDVGNDGQPHILAKGVYTVTKAGPHDLNVFQNPSLYWPDETGDPCLFSAGDNFPASFEVREVIYVDVNAPGPVHNGNSWETAYKYLRDALAVAEDGNDILVADGNYYPDANSTFPDGSGNREATFQLINGVALYGGYTGYGATDPNARDIQLYETILSGDLDGNDTQGLDPCDLPNDPNRGENSYHVVTGSGTDATAVLDGFTITASNANSSGGDNRYGGGMFNISGSPTVTNCTFSGNTADDYGGGMFNVNSSSRVTNCTFSGNSATAGGGMYNDQSSPTVLNCTFSGNSSGFDGGGMYNYSSNPNLINCIFSGNSAGNDGGGMSNDFDSSPTLTNCTFSGNSAGNDGGGMSNDFDSNPTLTNCILWGNTALDGNEIALYSSSTDVNYCDIKDGNDGIYNDRSTINWGVGNIDADPCFVDANGPDGQIGTEDDNLRLMPDSPCIDAGDNNSVPEDANDLDGDGNTVEPLPWDLDGRDRIADGDCNDTVIVDMGAYEFTYAYYGDFDGSCDVDFVDYTILANYWLTDELLVDIAPTPAGDGIVDERDLNIFCDNWLFGK